MLTNAAQPPPILAPDGGLRLTILQRNLGQKWLGCMLAAAESQSQNIDLEYHWQQPSNFFLRKPLDVTERKRFRFQTPRIFQCGGFMCRVL